MFDPEKDDRADLPRRKIDDLQSGSVAVYYRDGYEGVWVKFDKEHHFPASFEPGKWKQTAHNEPLDPDEIVSVIQNIENLAGSKFTVEIPAGKSLDELRVEVLAEFGREIHIQVTIGPAEKVRGTNEIAIDFPLTAVDDGFLTGGFSFSPPRPGMVLVVGYFK